MIQNVFMKLRSAKRHITSVVEVVQGYLLYKKIMQKYTDAIQICVNQHQALGDTYLMALYLPGYCQGRNYVITVIGNGSKKLYETMGFDNTILLSVQQTNALISVKRFLKISDERIKILHYHAWKWHIGLAWQLQGVNGLHFARMVEQLVFEGMNESDRKYPKVYGGDIERIFKERGLPKGKTVILFPHSNTLEELPEELWEKLAEGLKQQGKTVCTYIWEKEKVIKGTPGVRFQFEELIGAAEYAGGVILMRSGMADIIGRAKCRKMILYPTYEQKEWIRGSLYDFWSVKKFGYCDDVEEYEYTENHTAIVKKAQSLFK